MILVMSILLIHALFMSIVKCKISDLKDNMFHSFPMSAVKILKKLQSLNLANNRISNITAEPFTRLETIRQPSQTTF